MNFGALAQDFVEAASSLVGNRTINIMDKEAVIIASTDQSRIGNFHQGAAEVIATGKPVLIRTENLPDYPGAKEGYNMPIIFKNELIGVVGIFGCEEQVRDIANLLRVYVTQYFQQQASNKKQKLENDVRTQLLRMILLGDESQIETIEQLAEIIQYKAVFPAKVIVLSTKSEEKAGIQIKKFSQLANKLVWTGIIDKGTDIYGIHNNQYVIIKSNPKKLINELMEDREYVVSVSGECCRLGDIPTGMKEACTLGFMQGENVRDIENKNYKMKYLIHGLLEGDSSIYIKEMYERFLMQEPAQAEILLMTADIYYQEGGSVARSAERLHIHKNTLLYRMKRLFSLMEMESEQAFVREFFIRLILEYRPVKQLD